MYVLLYIRVYYVSLIEPVTGELYGVLASMLTLNFGMLILNFGILTPKI